MRPVDTCPEMAQIARKVGHRYNRLMGDPSGEVSRAKQTVWGRVFGFTWPLISGRLASRRAGYLLDSAVAWHGGQGG
jgi:hypothetical protein